MQAIPALNYQHLYEQSQLRITELERQLDQLRKAVFGSKHERFIPADVNTAQLSLDIQAEAATTCNVTEARKVSYIKTKTTVEDKPLSHPGRMKLPDHLRREEIVIEPKEDVSGCRKMGEEITETLEWNPGELYVKKYVRNKYSKQNNEGVLIGELPVRPLEKSLAGEGLLAQIVIDKFVDHLPLYRQMQRFERNNVKLPYSTLTEWVSSTCRLIEPVFQAVKKLILSSNYLHADETPIKVMDKDKKGETHRGYYWVYQDSTNKLVFFDYQEGRGREGPSEILQNFTGYLQVDGYSAYEIFNKPGTITLMHCMAHARRMFNEALSNDEARASYALEQIQVLYAVEKLCKDQGMDYQQRFEARQQKSLPVLQALLLWMKEQYMQVTPKSPIGKALAYSIERWTRLMVYVQDGKLNIDNNPVENSIRPVALGRKNYLFAGSHEAAKRSGMFYTLMSCCKMHQIEPYTWLKDVLSRIALHPINRIEELLPHNWTKLN